MNNAIEIPARRRLGRTNLEVSAIGLGCGGHSRLGLSKAKDHQNAVAVVRQAIELGVNLIDTAAGYQTEEAVGEALAGQREHLVIATKFGASRNGQVRSPADIEETLDHSLRKLRTEVIDLYQLHAVKPQHYSEVTSQIYPVLQRLREKGKIRFIGITESFSSDRSHNMLQTALQDGFWDTIMVGFNFINPSARPVLQAAREKDIGVLGMFAIRRALADVSAARELIQGLIQDGQLKASDFNLESPLDFLLEETGGSIAEAGYRFCLHEPGIDSVLSGTGSIPHLHANLITARKPPLSPETRDRLDTLFGHINTVTGD